MPRVLIIDDVAMNREVVAHALIMGGGYDVITASDGETGISMVSRDNPDLVIVDLSMPNIDGFETARLIRATSDIPIDALTAYAARPPTEERARDAGCNAFERKPIVAGSLLETVRKLLSDAEQSAA